MCLRGVAMNIREEILKNYVNDLIYMKGADIYNTGLVEDFDVNIKFNDKSQINTYCIDTWVRDKDNGGVFNVQVSFNDSVGFTSFYCDCITSFKGLGKKGVCEHMVAAVLKYLREKKTNTLKEVSHLKCEKLVEEIESTIFTMPKSKKPLKIDIKYCFNNGLSMPSSIELRIGYNKTYVVKDLERFFSLLCNGGSMELCKSFMLDMSVQEFCGVNKSIIDILMEIREIDKLKSNLKICFQSKNKFIAGKKAFITDCYLIKLLRLMKNDEFPCSIEGKAFKHVRYLEEDMPLGFVISRNGKYIELEHNHAMPKALTEKKNLFFFKGNIYKPSAEQLKSYIPIYNTFVQNNDMLKLTDKDIDKMANCIIPCLKQISDEVIMDEEIRFNFKEEKFCPELYLDLHEDHLVCKATFKYGDIKFNPLIENREFTKNNKRLIRDTYREHRIMCTLKEMGFKGEKEVFIIRDHMAIDYFLKEGIKDLKVLAKVHSTKIF